MLALLALLPAGASAMSSVAVFSDPGDFLGEGRQDVFGAGSQVSTATASLVSGDHVVVHAYAPALGAWKLTFAAPAGERLQARNYVDVQRAEFRRPGHAGLSATADAQRECDEVYGRFEIRDIVRRADGSVRRLWAVFQLHCEGKVPATWGEVRIGVATSATTPAVVRWPEQDSWQTATRVPVRFEGAAALAGVSLVGAQAGDFVADDGGCRATACTVHVAFRPTAAGARAALLRLTDAVGGVHDVALEGFRHGGITRTVIEDVLRTGLEPDRPPRTYVHEPSSSRFSGVIYESGLVLVYVEDVERWWEARWWPGAAGWQAGRTYADATSGSGGGERPAMYVDGRDRPCAPSSEGGSFTVHSISREPDGGLRTFDVSFDQPCYEGERRPALRGRWQYRAGDTTPFADWLVPGPRAGLGDLPPAEPPPLEGASSETTPTATGGGAAGVATSGLGDLPPAEPPPLEGASSETTPTDAGATTSPSATPASAAVTAAPTATGGGAAGVATSGEPRALSNQAGRQAVAACERRNLRRVVGTARPEVLRGSARADRVLGRGGRDRLLGRGGSDCLYGGAGDDRLEGGTGRDVLFGGAGNDVLAGGPGSDELDCGVGRQDRAIAGPGDRTRGCERVQRATG